MRSERRAHALVQGERLAVRVEPALLRHGVLGEEADQVARGALGAEVAGAPVPELLGRDLHQVGTSRTRDLTRAVARTRVDHDQLEVALRADAGEHLLEALLPILHRDDDRDRASGQRSRHLRLRQTRAARRATENSARATGLRITALRSMRMRSSQ